MPLISIKFDPSRRELRQFAAIWFPVFAFIVGWFAWKATANLTVVAAICSLAVLLSVLGYFAPGLMRYVFVGFNLAAYPIGWLIGHVLLGVIYYLVVTPIGLALRVMGRDPIQRSLDRSCTTYWRPHSPDDDTARYFRQH
jgi:Saxitoxin biosynthesis operon protein SxtJ